MTWLFSNLIGKSIINSASKDFKGAKVPEVRKIFLGHLLRIYENPTPGFKQESVSKKS